MNWDDECCDGADPATVARWGCYRAPYTYCDDLGPGGPTFPRLAQATGRQLGQLPDVPAEFPCPEGQTFDMSKWACVPDPYYMPGGPPAGGGGELPPGGVEDRPCTYWEKMTGICPPSGTMPAGGPVVPPELPGGGMPGGTMPEQACGPYVEQAREKAFREGKQEAHGEVIKVAAISAAVSAVVGGVLGYFLGQ
jgi:hypothetical protein